MRKIPYLVVVMTVEIEIFSGCKANFDMQIGKHMGTLGKSNMADV